MENVQRSTNPFCFCIVLHRVIADSQLLTRYSGFARRIFGKIGGQEPRNRWKNHVARGSINRVFFSVPSECHRASKCLTDRARDTCARIMPRVSCASITRTRVCVGKRVRQISEANRERGRLWNRLVNSFRYACIAALEPRHSVSGASASYFSRDFSRDFAATYSLR